MKLWNSYFFGRFMDATTGSTKLNLSSEKPLYISEFPESLVSDSKFRDSQWKTRNRTRIGPRYFSIQSLGIEVPRYSRLKGRKCLYLWQMAFFIWREKAEKRESDSKFETLGSGLGIGVLTYKVSYSESGLGKLWFRPIICELILMLSERFSF